MARSGGRGESFREQALCKKPQRGQRPWGKDMNWTTRCSSHMLKFKEQIKMELLVGNLAFKSVNNVLILVKFVTSQNETFIPKTCYNIQHAK
jgi:hypothetical protein